MQLIKASYKIILQNPGVQGIYEQAELPGRICYGSQDKIAPGTAEKFIKGLMQSNHGAPLEHNGVYLDCPKNVYDKYVNNKFSKTYYHNTGETYIVPYNTGETYIVPYNTGETYIVPYKGYVEEVIKYYVSTNLRVLFENDWLDDLRYVVEPTEYHEKRITVAFTVDRFTGEEFLRHRAASFNRESTRYINYSKDKFGAGDIKFILPSWIDDNVNAIDDKKFRELCYSISIGEDYDEFSDVLYWLFSLKAAEYSYNNLIRLGWQPQQARTVLPCAINSPLIKTAFVSDWCHFFNLRALGTTGKPHPQAKELAEPLMNEFINQGLVKLIENPKETQRTNIPFICIKQ